MSQAVSIESTPAPQTLRPLRCLGLILAGGQGSRMGGQDKGLVLYRSRPMIEHVLARFAPQVGGHLIINANRSHEAYARYGFPVVPDHLSGFAGPLAGLAAGMQWALETGGYTTADCIITVPCDSPHLPLELTASLEAALTAGDAQIAVARTPSGAQPVFACYALALLPSLQAFLASGRRKIDQWTAQHRTLHVDFADETAFANINTVEDLLNL